MQLAELQYALEDAIPTQRVLRLRIGAADVRLAMDRAASKLRQEASVPGFRKGKAPRVLIRKYYAKRVEAESFNELKRDALDQVFKLLDDKDKPFTPPEVLDAEHDPVSGQAPSHSRPQAEYKLRYGRPFEFAVKYLVDPAGLSRQPEQPQQQGAVVSGAQVQHPILQGMGIPSGPKLPAIPGLHAGMPTQTTPQDESETS